MSVRTFFSRLTRWTVVLLLLEGVVVLLALALPGHIDRQYAAAVSKADFMFDGCHKAWAHRGHTAEAVENTLASVQAAFGRQASGVEVDILYDVPGDQFIVSHDRPYQRTGGELLTLDALLQEMGDQGYFWLDAKDLGKLMPWDARRAVARLAATISQHQLQDRVLVESRNPLYLSWLSARGIHTSFMISPNDKKYSPLVFRANLYAMKWAYTLGPFSAFSMSDRRFTPATRQALGDQVPVLLSIVVDRREFDDLAKSPQVKVILTDNLFYDVDTCARGEATTPKQ